MWDYRQRPVAFLVDLKLIYQKHTEQIKSLQSGNFYSQYQRNLSPTATDN